MRRLLRASLPGTSLPGSLYAPHRTVGQTNFVTLGRDPSVGQMAARRTGKQPATGAGLLPEEGELQRDTERDRGQRQNERRQDRREQGAEGSRGKKRQRAERQRKGETERRGEAAGGRGTRQRRTDRR